MSRPQTTGLFLPIQKDQNNDDKKMTYTLNQDC